MFLAAGTEGFYGKLSEEQLFRLIRQAGFDGIDYSSFLSDRCRVLFGTDYRDQAQLTRQQLEEHSLCCYQAHAPFRRFTFGDAFSMDDPHFQELVRSIEYAAVLGAEHIVIHGIAVPNASGGEATFEYNLRFFRALEPYAKAHGIRIALENQRYTFNVPYMLNEMLSRLASDTFVACVDVGHAMLSMGSPEAYISCVTPGMVRGLHIHDNNGVTDEHLLPGLGVLRWDAILQALAKTGYSGTFTLETCFFDTTFDAAVMPELLALEAAVGRQLIRDLERIRSAT